jgi:chromate transporter
VASDPEQVEHPESPTAIFIRFLKFGCLAWGGPAAQIAMVKRECVDEEMSSAASCRRR